jgi:hypothetical protein
LDQRSSAFISVNQRSPSSAPQALKAACRALFAQEAKLTG